MGDIIIKVTDVIPSYKILALGKHRLYLVKDEPELTNGLHLELLVGKGQ